MLGNVIFYSYLCGGKNSISACLGVVMKKVSEYLVMSDFLRIFAADLFPHLPMRMWVGGMRACVRNMKQAYGEAVYHPLPDALVSETSGNVL